MKAKTIWTCDTCGFESDDREAVVLCEASHLGLASVEDKQEYERLLSKVKVGAKLVSRINTDGTRGVLDKAVADLMAFKVAHGMNIEG